MWPSAGPWRDTDVTGPRASEVLNPVTTTQVSSRIYLLPAEPFCDTAARMTVWLPPCKSHELYSAQTSDLQELWVNTMCVLFLSYRVLGTFIPRQQILLILFVFPAIKMASPFSKSATCPWLSESRSVSLGGSQQANTQRNGGPGKGGNFEAVIETGSWTW